MFVALVVPVNRVILVQILVAVGLVAHVDMVLVALLLVIHVRRHHHLPHSWVVHVNLL